MRAAPAPIGNVINDRTEGEPLMPTLVGIHSFALTAGVHEQEFERFMIEQVLPAAAEVPGSVNRGGTSSIKSQHLLESSDGSGYLWLVKASGVFTRDLFERVFQRMYEDLRTEIERFCSRESSKIFSVRSSFDAGPRDKLGRPLGEPERGDFI
jgi:hypothetical protein